MTAQSERNYENRQRIRDVLDDCEWMTAKDIANKLGDVHVHIISKLLQRMMLTMELDVDRSDGPRKYKYRLAHEEWTADPSHVAQPDAHPLSRAWCVAAEPAQMDMP